MMAMFFSEQSRRRSSSITNEKAALKEDLSLAMMELDSVTQENEDLQFKIKRYIRYT